MVLPSLKARLAASLLVPILALAAHAEPAGPILFAAATDAQLQPLIAKLDAPVVEHRAAWQFWLGSIAGKKVVLTRTEGDPLNATAATTLAIRRYHPRLVVTFGVSRALDPALQPGDVVVSEKFATIEGMISDVTPLDGGSAPLAWHRLPQQLATAGEKETPVYSFPADAGALAVAKTLTASHGRVVAGVPGSAHQVNREADRMAWIHAQWGASSEDGESAHVAGCAALLGVPAVGLRVIDGTEAEAAALALQFLEATK